MKKLEARLDLRVDPEIKQLAARACALLGTRSLSEFVVQAIREKSARAIEESEVIRLSNEAFDAFAAACSADSAPNAALMAAQRRREKRIEQGDITHREIKEESA